MNMKEYYVFVSNTCIIPKFGGHVSAIETAGVFVLVGRLGLLGAEIVITSLEKGDSYF